MRSHDHLTRRHVLALAGLGAAASVLAGCGSYERCRGDDLTDPLVSPGASDAERSLATLTDIPVGEAVLVRDEGCASIIVARPEEAKAAAFRAICPHRRVVVALEGVEAVCPAHDAVFSATTGAVMSGPAESGLPQVPVSVGADGVVRLA